MAASRKSPEAARAAVREIGRLTVLRLVVYYVMAGILLLCLSALLPQEAIGPTPSQPPPDMQGAIEVLEDGLNRLDRMFDKYREPSGRNQLALDDHDLAEEALKGLLIYRGARDIQGPPIDESEPYPGKSLWQEPELQGLIQTLSEKFQRWQGGGTSN